MKLLAVVLCLTTLSGACVGDKKSPVPKLSESARSSATDSLLEAGRLRYVENDFEGARTAWLGSLSTARSRRDVRSEASLYTWLGLAAFRMGDIDSARAWMKTGLSLRSQIPPPNEMWRSLNALGLLALDEARNDSAARLFEAALMRARSDNDSEGVAKATGNAALAYANMGDLVRARAGSRAMRLAGHEIGDRRVEANGLANEAMVDIWEGDAVRAIARLDTSRAIYREIHNVVGEQNALGQLATADELTGDVGSAFARLDSALELSRRYHLQEQVVESLRLLGELHSRLGDHRRALHYFAEAESLSRNAGLSGDLASVLRGSAGASLGVGNLIRAEAQAREALRLHRASEEPLDETDDLTLLQKILDARGNHAGAKALLDSAEVVARGVNGSVLLALVSIARAARSEMYGEASSPTVAMFHDIDPDDPALGSDISATIYDLLARASLRRKAPADAVEYGAKAVAAIERVRSSLSSQQIRSIYMADRADVYGEYIAALLLAGRSREAFTVADRARSRVMVENLAAIPNGPATHPATFSLKEADRLLRRIDALTVALQSESVAKERGAGNSEGAERILSQLRDAQAEYERLMIRSRLESARSGTFPGDPAPIDVRETQASLRREEILLEYYLARDTLYTFVVTSGSFSVLVRPFPLRLLSDRVRLITDLWGKPGSDWSLGLPAAGSLYSDLISPALKLPIAANKTAIITVPHGILSQVPFAALHDPASRNYLVQRFSLLSVPSASALVGLRRKSNNHDQRVSGVAAFAPFTRQLRFSLPEVDGLKSIMKVTVRIDAEASERSFRNALISGNVVHAATHGLMNYRNPLFSRIELSRGLVASGSENDGRLEVREVLGLDVKSPLVFLNGCETGALDSWSSDGVRATGDLAISQALLSAGAQNVASALWRIDDAGASVFSKTFYQALHSQNASAAFAVAQRSVAGMPGYASPYYWAGYVLSGSGEFSLGAQKINRDAVK